MEPTTTPATPNDTQDAQPPKMSPSEASQASRSASDALAEGLFPDIKETTAVETTPAAPAVPAEPPVETPVSEEPPVETPPTPTGTPAPVATATPEVVENPQEDEEIAPPPVPALSPIDPSAFVDENGYVDVNKLSDAFNQRLSSVQQTASAAAQRELQAQRIEERGWSQATEKYPQLKTDRALRDIVQNARIGRTTEMYRAAGNDATKLAAIKIPTPAQVASQLFDRLAQAKTEGVKTATETTVMAASTHLETASTPVVTSSKKEQLFQKIRDPKDPIGANEAQRELLKELLFTDNN